MTTKQIFIIVVLVIIIGATSLFFVLKPKTVVQTQNIISPPTPTSVSLLIWMDEAGFSFQYPAGTEIDKHPDDTVNYANLTLTFPDNTTAQIIMSDIAVDQVASATFTDEDVMVFITGGHKDTIINSWKFIYPTPTIGKTLKVNTPQSDSDDVLEEE